MITFKQYLQELFGGLNHFYQFEVVKKTPAESIYKFAVNNVECKVSVTTLNYKAEMQIDLSKNSTSLFSKMIRVTPEICATVNVIAGQHIQENPTYSVVFVTVPTNRNLVKVYNDLANHIAHKQVRRLNISIDDSSGIKLRRYEIYPR